MVEKVELETRIETRQLIIEKKKQKEENVKYEPLGSSSA